MNLVLNQTEKLEQQVEDYHSGRMGALLGISPLQAVNAFLRKSVTLETYGIDPHPVKVPIRHFYPFISYFNQSEKKLVMEKGPRESNLINSLKLI